MIKHEKDTRAGKYFIIWQDHDGQRQIERKGRVIAAGDMCVVEFHGELNELGNQDVVPAADLDGASLYASSEEWDAVIRAETRKAAGK